MTKIIVVGHASERQKINDALILQGRTIDDIELLESETPSLPFTDVKHLEMTMPIYLNYKSGKQNRRERRAKERELSKKRGR